MLRVSYSEAQRNLKRMGIIVFLIFLITGSVIFQFGINKYNTVVQHEKEFQRVEKETVACFINYIQYGTYGFRLKLTPSALYSIFYNNTAFNDLIATIDTAIRLKLEETKQCQNVFSKPTGSILDLSWYLLIMGSLLVMAWSFFTFKDIAYFRYIHNFVKTRHIFAGVVIARMAILAGAVLSVFLLILVQLAINGITLSWMEIKRLAIFALLLFAVMTLLLLISAALGTLNSKKTGALVLAFTWFAFVMIWPEAYNMVFSTHSENTIDIISKNELQKLKIMNKFEIAAIKKSQRYSKPEDKKNSDREMAEYHFKNILPKIESVDKYMISIIEKMAKKFHLLSILNPFTFLKSVDNEISSCGYNGYIEVFSGNLKKRREFLRFIYDKRFYQIYSKPVPFIPVEKAVIVPKNSLPHYFGLGLLVLGIYLTGAVLFSYYRFKKAFYGFIEKDLDAEIELDLTTGFHYLFDTYDDNFLNIVLHRFWGVENRLKKIYLDGKELSIEKREFEYIPSPYNIPENYKLKYLYRIAKLETPGDYKNKTLSDLPDSEKFKVLVDVVKKVKSTKLVVLDKYCVGLQLDDEASVIKGILNNLKETAIILDFKLSGVRDFLAPTKHGLVLKKEGTKVLKLHFDPNEIPE